MSECELDDPRAEFWNDVIRGWRGAAAHDARHDAVPAAEFDGEEEDCTDPPTYVADPELDAIPF